MPGLFDRLQSEIEGRERQAGLSPVDLLDLPDAGRRVVQLLARQGELADAAIAEGLGLDAPALEPVLADLVERGFILRRAIRGIPHSRTYFGQRRAREVPLNIWDTLAERTAPEDTASQGAPRSPGEAPESGEGGDGGG